MFDQDGGLLNVLIGGLNILFIIIFVVCPFMIGDIESRKRGIAFAVIGLIVYAFLFYVANPELTFWKVK